MAVTPNYSWPIPVATDYVKDGWDAIADLGNAIDTTVATLGSGLTLVKTQTIGTAVSNVVVTGAFNATYDAYKIIITGGSGSTATNLGIKLGSSTASYTLAYFGVSSGGSSSVGLETSQAQFNYCGTANTNFVDMNVDLHNPYLAKWSMISARQIIANGSVYSQFGSHQVTTSYTDFTITTAAGTLTGGEIRVYGYQK